MCWRRFQAQAGADFEGNFFLLYRAISMENFQDISPELLADFENGQIACITGWTFDYIDTLTIAQRQAVLLYHQLSNKFMYDA